MNDHVDTALDQLRNADDAARTPAQQCAVFLGAAGVHALLAVAEAIRAASVRDLSVFEPSTWPKK